MSEYYAVVRSTDHLEHYGVRGMKWGVRKAIERGSDRKLSKQYFKAQKKLAKLNERANIDVQKARASKYGKRAARAGVDTALAGAIGGAAHLVNKRARQVSVNGIPVGTVDNATAYNLGKAVGDDRYARGIARTDAVRKIGGAAAVVGLGRTAYNAAKAGAAKKRTTAAGHAKAVMERNEFKKEMYKAFAGTKYGTKKKSRR